MNNINKILEIIKPKSIIVGDKLNCDLKYDKQIEDARSAAFYAFGESKITNENVVLMINGDYLPNVYTVLTEAWFQKTNLIVIALYNSIYEIETNYMNRCTVANLKLIDKDYNQFEEKIKKSLKLVGPKLINIVTDLKENQKNDYSNIIKELNKVKGKEDIIYTYNSKNEDGEINIPSKYKYGVISKYLAYLEGKENKNILICDKSCVEVDSNIFNSREMNNNFKMIVLGNIKKTEQWIKNNNIDYVESNNLKDDIEMLYQSKTAMVLVVKGDE